MADRNKEEGTMHRGTFVMVILIAAVFVPLSAAAAPVQTTSPSPHNIGIQILSDTRGFDFGPYLNQVLNRLRTTWYGLMPESARGGKKGRTVIDFNLDRDGTVHDVRLLSRAGIPDMDSSAKSAVEKADPFVKIPANSTVDRLDLRVTFYYNSGLEQ
jgi:TonB family protein